MDRQQLRDEALKLVASWDTLRQLQDELDLKIGAIRQRYLEVQVRITQEENGTNELPK